MIVYSHFLKDFKSFLTVCLDKQNSLIIPLLHKFASAHNMLIYSW